VPSRGAQAAAHAAGARAGPQDGVHARTYALRYICIEIYMQLIYVAPLLWFQTVVLMHTSRMVATPLANYGFLSPLWWMPSCIPALGHASLGSGVWGLGPVPMPPSPLAPRAACLVNSGIRAVRPTTLLPIRHCFSQAFPTKFLQEWPGVRPATRARAAPAHSPSASQPLRRCPQGRPACNRTCPSYAKTNILAEYVDHHPLQHKGACNRGIS
jgi:hypothetical protein